MTITGNTGPQESATVNGSVKSFKTTPRGDGFVTRALIENDNMSVLCLWRHDDRNTHLATGQKYIVRGTLRTRNDRYYMIQPSIEEVGTQESLEHDKPARKSFSLAKLSMILGVLILIFSATAYGLYGYNKDDPGTNNASLNTGASGTVQPANGDGFDTSTLSETTQAPTTSEPNIDIEDLFSNYSSTYDASNSSYSFDYNDLSSYLSDYGSGSSSLSNATYRSGNETWTVNCYEYLNSCTARSSSGASASTYCYEYLNSCTTRGSDGSSYSTNCYEYLDSCNTRSSNGYSSNTYCYEHLNSCSTRGSDGSYSNTYCYSYLDSCSTYGSGGYSTFDW